MSPSAACLWCAAKPSGASGVLCDGCAPSVHFCRDCVSWHTAKTQRCAACTKKRAPPRVCPVCRAQHAGTTRVCGPCLQKHRAAHFYTSHARDACRTCGGEPVPLRSQCRPCIKRRRAARRLAQHAPPGSALLPGSQ